MVLIVFKNYVRNVFLFLRRFNAVFLYQCNPIDRTIKPHIPKPINVYDPKK